MKTKNYIKLSITEFERDGNDTAWKLDTNRTGLNMYNIHLKEDTIKYAFY